MSGQNFYPKRKFNGPRIKEPEHKLNEKITHPTIRVVMDGYESIICTLNEALAKAKEFGVDLVEISTSANPPVCKIIDYQKFLYDKKKKEKEAKKNNIKAVVKEIRMSPTTDQHDFDFKFNNAVGFLEKGNKVKVSILFKGRMIMHKNQGELLMARFADALSEYGKVEQLPKLEGKNMTMFVSPRKK